MKNWTMNSEVRPTREQVMVYAFMAVTQASCAVALAQVFYALAAAW